MESAPGAPARLEHRLLGTAHDNSLPGEATSFVDGCDVEFGAVPGHPRVVPGGPRQLLAVGRESRERVEIVAAGDDHRRRAAVGRQRDQLGYGLPVGVLAFVTLANGVEP